MPPYSKMILVLANSRKTSGRCIAGRSIENGAIGEWIRPVSNRPAGELSEDERRFEDGKDPSVLDIVSIPMAAAGQHPYQPENHIIDDRYYWRFVRRASAAELHAALDNAPSPLWGHQYAASSTSGLNDRVDANAASQFRYSLGLIQVQDLKIRVSVEGARFGDNKRKIRGLFTYHRCGYHLMITDPTIERHYFSGPNGIFDVGSAILCVSLGDAYSGHAYKLIAAVLLPQTLTF